MTTPDKMREREQAMLLYAWSRWAAGLGSTVRGLGLAAGYVSTPHGRCPRRVIERLVEGGWLAHSCRNHGGYTVGPRFGGVDKAGRVYQVVA